MIQLCISLAGLLLGPIAYRFSRRREGLYGCIDGFVLVGVSGLILTEVLPETVAAAGYWAIACAAAGFVLPLLLERRLSLLPFSPNAFFRWLMILGLILHQLLDGVALSEGLVQGGGVPLRMAVILHQVPKGFFIWSLVGETLGVRAGIAVIGGLCLATAGGFGLGDRIALLLEAQPLWLFQAFIGGGLLHVIFHHVPLLADAAPCAERLCGCGDRPAASRRFSVWSGIGALVSLAGLVWMHRLQQGPDGQGGFGTTFANLALESAPSILLGFLAAGLFQAFLPRLVFSWFRGRGRMSQALRGIALGVPLPICSCGVVPVYLSLLRKNVPPAAALAFLIATPEIGIDSFFLSRNLLGLEITLIRLTMAFLIALAVGLTLAKTFEKIQLSGEIDSFPLPRERTVPPTVGGKLREAARFGGLEIVDHTGAWLLAGLAVAALIGPDRWQEWIRSLPRDLDVILLSLIGLPLYVCASGATPLAAILLQNGVSTGAVLAFLITGPSTNMTTFGILRRYHGTRGAVLFAAAVYGFTIAIGLGINHLFTPSSPPIAQTLAHSDHGVLNLTCAGLLGALFAGSIIRLGPRGFLAALGDSLGAVSKGHDHGHDHGHGGGHGEPGDPCGCTESDHKNPVSPEHGTA